MHRSVTHVLVNCRTMRDRRAARFHNRRSFSHSHGFQWNDALLLRDQLTVEERAIHETAVAYATEKLLPRIIVANRHESFDRDIMYELGTAQRFMIG